MKKKVVICLFIGCLLIGIVIVGFFRETNRQSRDYSARELTEEEKEETIKIALNDANVKEMLKGKEYKVSETVITSVEKGEREKRVLWTYPAVIIYAGEDDWMKTTRIRVLVDLDNKKVINVLEKPIIESIMTKEVSEKEREEAKIIALSNEGVKEKLEGLEYRIIGVFDLENLKTDEKLGTQVYIHINGTTICYTPTVDLTERRVIKISEIYCADRIGIEKSERATDIALNDPRVKEKIGRKGYEVTVRQRLIEKRLLVDVYIEMKEPPMTYIATVDPEEGKIIEIGEK